MSNSTISYYIQFGTSTELESLALVVGSRAQRESLLALATQRKQKEVTKA